MINKLSPLPNFLINRYKNWRSISYLNNSDKFKKLSTFGQNPSSLVISCCDSRVHATSIFQAEEGDFFIHRNIANLVPPFSLNGEHSGTLAAIEFAVIELKVSHIIIMGHTQCGGIKNGYYLHTNKNKSYLFINKWLSILLPSFKKISKSLSHESQIEELEKESIKTSLENLFTFPFIIKRVEDKNLKIHGLLYDLATGGLKHLNPLTGKFENI